MFHHAYKDGYSVLPQLKKIDGPAFKLCGDWKRFEEEKWQAVRHQTVFAQHHFPDELWPVLCDFIWEKYPDELCTRWELEQTGKDKAAFLDLVMKVQEDIAVHMIDGNKDWLAMAHVCFPSGWLPEEKIGRPLEEIHRPIPGMNLANSRKLVEAMVKSGPFERHVWSVIFEDRINGHPRMPKLSFDPKNPRVFVKVERQVTWGLPKYNAAVFILRQHIIPEHEIDKLSLAKAIFGMTEEQKAYKGLDKCYEPLMAYLTKSGPCAS